jgi:hypothetical protein
MESKTLNNLVSLLLTEARQNIGRLDMPEESWDMLVGELAVFQRRLTGIYEAVVDPHP